SHPVLLALLRASVARQETFFLQLLAKFQVVFDERARNTEAHCARLPRHAATVDRRQDVELVGGFCQPERPANLCSERLGGEERFEGALVDADGPGAGAEEHASGRCLATTCAVILDCCHVTRPRASWVSAPNADDPDRHTPSICDTSPGP